MPKPFTPFQWFGQNTVGRAAAQDQPAARRPRRKAKGVQLKWHDPKATLVEGIVSRGDRRLGPVIEDVWRARRHLPGVDRALRPRACGSTPWPATASTIDWYVHRHRTEDEVLPWDHLSAGLHKDFLWQDWRDALAELGLRLPLDPLLRLRRLHRLPHRAHRGLGHPARRRQPGHRPGPRLGGSVPGRPARAASPAPVRTGGAAMRVRLRFRKLGKVRFTSHRDVARLWERALRRAELPGRQHRGLLAPARSCTSGWRCPPATSRWPSTSTST